MNQTAIAAVVEDQKHALLSPSSAYTWIECAASTAAQIGQPDESSEYADEGTAAHELAKWCLTENRDAESYVGRIIPVGTVTRRDEESEELFTEPRRAFEVDEDMAEAVQVYVDAVRARVAALELAGAEVQLLAEQRLSIAHITGETDAFGTSDCVIIATWPDGRAELEVRDLKYGRGVEVSAERNYQAMVYAHAALFEHDELFEFQRVNIVIHQPRINDRPSEWQITPAELEAWIGDTARPAAERAMLYVESDTPRVLGDFTPGEKQCKFCKAKAVCPALAAHVEQTIGRDFEALDKGEPLFSVELLANQNLGVIYGSLDLIEGWMKAVRGRIEHELLLAHPVPGVKLVAGRRGARQWNEPEAAEALLKSMRLKQDQMYNFKLISPTQADKLLKQDSPRRWKKVEALIVQRDGKPSVAPDTDSRPALVITPPEDDFEVADAAPTADDFDLA